MNTTRNEFTRLVAREPVPLAHGALLIAKEEYPKLDVGHYLERLAALARDARPVVSAGSDTIERVQLLSEFLFVERGFRGNRDEYSDPRNSFLNEVIDRRLGIPITLSAIYIEVGRRLNLNLYGISFPAHFLVKAVDERGELVIDPFNDGVILELGEIRERLAQLYGRPMDPAPAMLRAVGGRHILARMLRNLKNIYMHGGDWNRMLAALDRILLIDPRATDELLERAGLYEKLECFSAALHDFQSFLSKTPEHPGADAARDSVLRLIPRVSRLN
jgi:regulator of sirC expression with transglutaminase-like and TPR domain